MTDRKEVIVGLEKSINVGICGKCVNESWYGDKIVACKEILHDAIAMLKAQEPKHGQWITKQRNEHYPSGKPYEADYCSVCGKRGSIEYPSCPWCRAIMDNSQVDKLTEAAQWK